jgi:hypothetical protein
LANIENHCILSDLEDEDEDHDSDNSPPPKAAAARISPMNL